MNTNREEWKYLNLLIIKQGIGKRHTYFAGCFVFMCLVNVEVVPFFSTNFGELAGQNRHLARCLPLPPLASGTSSYSRYPNIIILESADMLHWHYSVELTPSGTTVTKHLSMVLVYKQFLNIYSHQTPINGFSL